MNKSVECYFPFLYLIDPYYQLEIQIAVVCYMLQFTWYRLLFNFWLSSFLIYSCVLSYVRFFLIFRFQNLHTIEDSYHFNNNAVLYIFLGILHDTSYDISTLLFSTEITHTQFYFVSVSV